MLLLLDIGNSRIKWGTLDDEHNIFDVHSRSYGNNGIGIIADNCWSGISPQRVIAANVAGTTITDELREWAQTTWQLEIEFLIPTARAYGVVNAYREPSSLGADRWAALVGAAQKPHGHLCVVDCGTAVTLDILSADNIHFGGLIVPGLRLMRDSLITGTAGIRYTWGTNANLFARDTGSAVAGGTLYALIALIDRVVADLAVALSATVTVLITGGDATLIVPLLAASVTYEENLILQGLAIAAMN